MSDTKPSENENGAGANANAVAAAVSTPLEADGSFKSPQTPVASANSTATTPASSVTGAPTSKLKAPTNFGGSTGAMSKIGRPCAHAAPKAGPPPRDTNSMSRESDDNLSSINSTYTDMYQETVKRFTRSSLSPEMDRYSPSRLSIKSNSQSQRSSSDAADRRTSYDFYLEATGRRRSSDHGAVLTFDTEQFIIGQRVWVGGIRPGQIAYIGETHFAPGEWAGIVLDEPNGKNDGCVSGKRYFQCEPRRGIFSRLTRLTMAPLPGACTTPTSPFSKFSPERSRTVSPTASIRSSFLRSPGGKNGLTVGDRVIVSSGFGSRPGILRYLGETQFASGNWCGIELDENTGKNDGSVDGIKYFECKPKYGVFVPIAKVSLSPSSKKTRLSRTGSRESLTSIGTMNSIATTNTSRMRFSAQRKPSSASIKPVTTPKSQFSMQDLLREKQNHIEQLMIERDLDREDAQNQALQLQKNISELKSRVSQLERKLEDERKKTEDLQFSIDEATFCGDELNAQTQVYKEKIHDLERKITDFSSGAPSLQTPSIPPPDNIAATAAANAQIAELTIKLNEQALQNQFFAVRLAEVQDEEKRQLENIKYLQTENETLQKELLDKDESLEKFSLSESGIENLRRELALLKEENEKERQVTNAEFSQKLEAKTAEAKRLAEELTAVKNNLGSLENEHTNKEDECEILRTECRTRDDQLLSLNEQLARLNAELSVHKAESATLDELLKAQQAGSAQGKSALEERLAEICKLKEEISGLQTGKAALEAKLQVAAEELQKLAALQKAVEEKFTEASSADQEKLAAMNKLETVMEELRQQVIETTAENEKLNAELKSSTEANVNVKAAITALRKELEEKEKHSMLGAVELKSVNEMVVKLRNDLLSSEADSKQTLASKTQDIERLTSEIAKLQEITKTLEGESSTTVQQLSAKIGDLEAQIKKQQETIKCSAAELELQCQERAKHEQLAAEKHAELKSIAAALETTSNQHNKLQLENEQVLGKCKELEEQLRRSDDACAHQKLELGDATRKLDASSTKCDSLARQIEALQQDILAARTCGSEIQTEVRKLNEELAAKQKAFAELQSQSNDERMRGESQNEELNQKLTNAAKDFSELKATLQKSRDELSKKSEQMTLLEEKTIKQELALSDALRQSENLQTKYNALAAQNLSLQNDLTAVRTTSTDSNAELLKLSQDIAAKQKANEELLDKTSGERAALEGQLQASQQRVDTLCSQVEALTQELKGTTEESFKRFEQLKQEQEKSGKQALELSDLTRKFDSLSAKCDNYESQNENLQKDLTTLRATSTDSNAEVLKLTEVIASKQKALQELTDQTSAERLQRESQMQELTQQLQTSRGEVESLQADLKCTTESKSQQYAEFEALKMALQANAQQELGDVQAKEAAERQKLVQNFEAQLKSAEQTKMTLDEAISSLQKQIQLLQDELLKSQLDFRSKEEELTRQINVFCAEKAQLSTTLAQVQSEGTTTLSGVQQEKVEMMQRLQALSEELKAREQQLQSAHSEGEQLKLQQSNTTSELAKLQTAVKTLESALERSGAEVEHKVKLAADDQSKIEELRLLLEALQASNANISATNAELAAALQLLEQEKCETANIFELFEMESDQNTEQLIDKMSNMKQELVDAQAQLLDKDVALAEADKSVRGLNVELLALQSALDAAQSRVLEHTTKLAELGQANAELSTASAAHEAQLREREDLQFQLAEYKQTVEEMDDAGTSKTAQLSQLEARVRELEQERHLALESHKALKLEHTNVLRKFESLGLERTREQVALQGRINDLQAVGMPRQNGAGDIVSQAGEESDGDSTAQINFLNSIIADMQKKNETLKAKIEALEALPTDYTKPSAFDLIARRKPAPRVFCDICDEFDKHETEDCPLQASDERELSPTPSPETNNNDPANKKERKLPEPRKYCDSCEVFGHDTGECDDECF